jgi:electron transport complex protein RnfB
MTKVTPEDIDALLPQTQCGLCGHGGCMPYAEAIVFENAPIHLCPPGGVPVLQQLGTLLGIDPAPYLADMQAKEKPKTVAIIREAECIGCAKCIKACPVDAIIGSGKLMHTVIADECTGCGLCIPPCPVDCIDLVELPDANPYLTIEQSALARKRFYAREKRIHEETRVKKEKADRNKLLDKKDYIAAALQRVQGKK